MLDHPHGFAHIARDGSKPTRPSTVIRHAQWQRTSAAHNMMHAPSLRKLPDDYLPVRADVMCGRDQESYMHEGNRVLRKLIDQSIPSYINASTKAAKSHIVATIVRRIRNGNPRGNFVRKELDTGRWVEIGDAKAKEKVGQAIRIEIRRIRAKSTNMNAPATAPAAKCQPKPSKQSSVQSATRSTKPCTSVTGTSASVSPSTAAAAVLSSRNHCDGGKTPDSLLSLFGNDDFGIQPDPIEGPLKKVGTMYVAQPKLLHPTHEENNAAEYKIAAGTPITSTHRTVNRASPHGGDTEDGLVGMPGFRSSASSDQLNECCRSLGSASKNGNTANARSLTRGKACGIFEKPETPLKSTRLHSLDPINVNDDTASAKGSISELSAFFESFKSGNSRRTNSPGNSPPFSNLLFNDASTAVDFSRPRSNNCRKDLINTSSNDDVNSNNSNSNIGRTQFSVAPYNQVASEREQTALPENCSVLSAWQTASSPLSFMEDIDDFDDL